MSEVDELPEHQDGDFDDRAHQACYIFRPFAADELDDRPKKKRKIKHAAHKESKHLPLLNNGYESEVQASKRYSTLRAVLSNQRNQIEQQLSANDQTVLGEIIGFTRSAKVSDGDGRLCTGLVVSGSDSSVQSRLSQYWQSTRSTEQTDVLIQLTTNLCPSLQIALRNIIKNVLIEVVGLEGYAIFLNKHKKLIPMNFDLELLQLFAEEHGLDRIVVSLLDVETFDTGILSQILWSMSSWSQRIPFIALLGIAATVELFESRLSKSVTEQLDATVFNLASSNDVLYQIFATCQTGPDSQVFMGPATLQALYELSQSQSTTAESFTTAIKLATMSHFFANSLSGLVGDRDKPVQSDSSTRTAILQCDSFKDHCEHLLEQGKAARATVRDLLQDTQKLLSTVHTSISDGQNALSAAFRTIASLRDLRKHLGLEKASPFLFDIELYNCLDDMRSSHAIQEILQHLRNTSSGKLLSVLESVQSSTLVNLGLQGPMHKMQEFQKVYRNDSVRATQEDASVISTAGYNNNNDINGNQFLDSTKSPARGNINSDQKQYTNVLISIISQLKGTISSSSCSFEPFMHEAFVVNNRHLLLSMMTPRPRQVLERALSKPADYLNCDCSAAMSYTISQATENPEQQHNAPPTSILYHLLQEAGTIINVRDLFDAFQVRLDLGTAIMNGSLPNGIENDDDGDHDDGEGIAPDPEDAMAMNHDLSVVRSEDKKQDEDQRMALSLFYRSLSELKMLGMVKSSTSAMTKKRALAFEGGAAAIGKGKKAYAEIDFIAKTSWAGL